MTALPNLHHWQEAERAMTAGPWTALPLDCHTEIVSGTNHLGRMRADADAQNSRALRNREPALLAAIAGVGEEMERTLELHKKEGRMFAYAKMLAALANLNAALARE